MIDEAAFLGYQTWVETIVPVLQQVKTSLIAASTALDDRNYFSSLTKLRDPDTGRLIFNTVRISQICSKCQETETPWLCTHLNYKLPAWKSAKKTNRMKAFYGEGQEHLHLREILGEVADSSRGAIASSLIKRFRVLEPRPILHPPKAIYMAVDPGGGGAGEMGIVACVDIDGEFIVSVVSSRRFAVRSGRLRRVVEARRRQRLCRKRGRLAAVVDRLAIENMRDERIVAHEECICDRVAEAEHNLARICRIKVGRAKPRAHFVGESQKALCKRAFCRVRVRATH